MLMVWLGRLNVVFGAGEEATNAATMWVTNGPFIFRNEVERKPGWQLPFDHFRPESLNNEVWTNILARTNSRSTALWTVRSHSPGWPAKPPIVEWSTNCLIWGMRGLTAISPCWEDEGGIGQCPVTALTRRHGYVRGHGMGPDGITKVRNGRRIWFVTTNNLVVQVAVKGMLVRTTGADYTIVLFDKDLPGSIEPMRVADPHDESAHYPPANFPTGPHPFLETEQGGNVGARIPGFLVRAWKGGDSGSPDMLPIGNELVFFHGRSTSGASAEMQRDMDTLSKNAGLNPSKYKLQWADLSHYPAY